MFETRVVDDPCCYRSRPNEETKTGTVCVCTEIPGSDRTGSHEKHIDDLPMDRPILSFVEQTREAFNVRDQHRKVVLVMVF